MEEETGSSGQGVQHWKGFIVVTCTPVTLSPEKARKMLPLLRCGGTPGQGTSIETGLLSSMSGTSRWQHSSPGRVAEKVAAVTVQVPWDQLHVLHLGPMRGPYILRGWIVLFTHFLLPTPI